MSARSVAGVFDSMHSAEQVRRLLLASGVEDRRISVAAQGWEDGVAAEAPGQSYENQPGQGSGRRRGFFGLLAERESAQESRAARDGEALRGGSCVVSVEALSRQEQKHIAHLLHRHGARRISERLP